LTLRERKEIEMPEETRETQHQEAPCSLHITCYVKGFKLGFTVRNGEPAKLAPKIPKIVEWLEKIGATPTPAQTVAGPQITAAPAPAPAQQPTTACPECGSIGVWEEGVNEKGKWRGCKCPACDKFIKGTFKRVK
jgi:hypothetical protein